jgi:Sulfotransferase family
MTAGTIAATSQRTPRLLRAANLIGRVAVSRRPNWVAFDIDELHRRAVAATKLEDFGDDRYLEPLGILLASLRDEAQLTPAGVFFARGAIVQSLSNRLRLQADWNRYPEIDAVRIDSPIFIVGLPRTGTTLLQNLLSLDQPRRNLLGWEAAHPSPPPTSLTYETDSRIRAAERTTRLLDYLAPQARSLHPVAPQMPTECVTLFNNSFASLELATIYQVWTYLDWCLQADFAPHYSYYHRQLKLLQWRNDRGPWLLKSPAHLFWLDELVGQFPDARVIQTHRDPLQAVVSFCSLAGVLQQIGSGSIESRGLGAVWPGVWAEGLRRASAARDRVDVTTFDCHYGRLVGDPISTVRELYATFEMELEPGFERRMRAWLASHRQHEGGVHTYSPEQFGMVRDVERARFAAYCNRFGIDQIDA